MKQGDRVQWYKPRTHSRRWRKGQGTIVKVNGAQVDVRTIGGGIVRKNQRDVVVFAKGK